MMAPINENTVTTTSTTIVVSKPEKPKRKNSEKRKEKSRKAARERRSQESKIFDQIEEILPVPPKTLDHLDKASLVRIAINYLKIRSVVDPFEVPNVNDTFDLFDGSLTNTLNGFLFVLSKDGDIIYLSENVERYLGLTNIDLIGQSVFDYSHPCDHDDIKSFLEPLTNAFATSRTLPKPVDRERKPLDESIGETNGPFFIRMKCTLTNKGRNLNLKSANYKTIKFTGRMVDLEVASPDHAQRIGENYRHYMISIGELIQHPSRIDIPFKSDVFISKHSPDMKFIHVDDSIEDLFGYNAKELIGTSFYQYFDVNDFTVFSNFFKTLFAKGQCDFGFYKFLVKTGGYRWISTQATVITEPNSNKPQSIILVNRIISGVENAQLITSDLQQATTAISLQPQNKQQPAKCAINLESSSQATATVSSTTASVASIIKNEPNNFESDTVLPVGITLQPAIPPPQLDSQLKPEPYLEKVQAKASWEKSQLAQPPPPYGPISTTENFISSTQTVLAPKTADMESGFLMFTEDNKGMTVLTDADDLTHLAPDAGDLCVPMLPEMDFNELSLLDELFVNSTSYNIDSANIFNEDEFFTNLTSNENDKLKLDSLDNLGLELENNNLNKRYDSTFMGLNNKGIPDIKSLGYDQQYPLSNDPFLSFTNQNDDLFISGSPTTRSDCSLTDSYSCSTNSPSNSSSPNSTQYSPQSTSCDEMTNKLSLCDTTDFAEDKDLEMRSSFIPIDDDYLLNDFSYSDSNMDDFFDWISNGNSNTLGMPSLISDMPSGGSAGIGGKAKSKSINLKPNAACLEALLQNDKLVGNLKKKKIYNSDQLLSIPTQVATAQTLSPPAQLATTTTNTTPVAVPASTGLLGPQTQSALKRKNSNILIYTTLANGGEKKIKNLVLTAATTAVTDPKLTTAAMTIGDKSTVHHFVLTKNNELIPKANLVAASASPQSFKVAKRVLPTDSGSELLVTDVNANTIEKTFGDLKDELSLKKARPDSDKLYSNSSVLHNLLVNGTDLPNGYNLVHQQQYGKLDPMLIGP